ncbi:hypothetical protein AMK19_16945 [Kitasatospora sp. CB01950]|nr:hypothetical protein AMK19_16945 [Kitasatospora sp. CB01950]
MSPRHGAPPPGLTGPGGRPSTVGIREALRAAADPHVPARRLRGDQSAMHHPYPVTPSRREVPCPR